MSLFIGVIDTMVDGGERQRTEVRRTPSPPIQIPFALRLARAVAARPRPNNSPCFARRSPARERVVDACASAIRLAVARSSCAVGLGKRRIIAGRGLAALAVVSDVALVRGEERLDEGNHIVQFDAAVHVGEHERPRSALLKRIWVYDIEICADIRRGGH